MAEIRGKVLGRVHTGPGGQACDTPRPPQLSGLLPGPAEPAPSLDPIRPGNWELRCCQQLLCSEAPCRVQVSPAAFKGSGLQVGQGGSACGAWGGDGIRGPPSTWHFLPHSSPTGCYHVNFRRWDKGCPKIQRQGKRIEAHPIRDLEGNSGIHSCCPVYLTQTLSSFFGSLPGFSSARNLVSHTQSSTKNTEPAIDPTGPTVPLSPGKWHKGGGGD